MSRFEVRYRGHSMPHSLVQGQILKVDTVKRPASGQMVMVRFDDGEWDVRRYFHFKKHHFFLTEGEWDVPIYRRATACNTVIASRCDDLTHSEHKTHRPNVGRTLRMCRAKLDLAYDLLMNRRRHQAA